MSFSFSPQFTQRWASTSKLIRQAIATELSDIIQLLQTETDLNEFEFTHPDLISYIDELEDQLDKQSSSIKPVPNHHPVTENETVETHTSDTESSNIILNDKQEALISGLEIRIDDYITDNMTRMSDDLKLWLRSEIKRQLSEIEK